MGVQVAMVTPDKKKKNKYKAEEVEENKLPVFDDWSEVDSKVNSFMTELSQSLLTGATDKDDPWILDVIQQCLMIVECNGLYQVSSY